MKLGSEFSQIRMVITFANAARSDGRAKCSRGEAGDFAYEDVTRRTLLRSESYWFKENAKRPLTGMTILRHVSIKEVIEEKKSKTQKV